jgi:rhamnogalacturonyl hydrolase YesR
MHRRLYSVSLVVIVGILWSFVLIGCRHVQDKARLPQTWGTWPTGSDPKELGRKVVNNLLTRPPATRPISYPEVCTAYGSFRFVDTIKDKDLLDKLMVRYSPIAEPDSRIARRNPTNVDAAIWGAMPLKIYQITHDEKYLALGLHCADYQWDSTPDFSRVRDEQRRKQAEDSAKAAKALGLTWHTRFWIDDMFMITGLQVNAYRATKDRKYLDRAAKEMVAYLDKLQQPNGLFHHRNPEAPIFWGRGNGWVAVGMTEILFDLPEDHPDRAKILAGYRKMMAALKQYQTADGMWRQIIDHEPSWLESSCTGMFTFAMANGVKKGWLDAAEYKEPSRRAWIALAKYIDDEGNMREVCIGTNTSTDIQFYMDRPRKTGDFHGQAGMIWACWAMLD